MYMQFLHIDKHVFSKYNNVKSKQEESCLYMSQIIKSNQSSIFRNDYISAMSVTSFIVNELFAQATLRKL